MEFAEIFAIGCSLTVLFALFINIYRHRGVTGAVPFMIQIIFVAVWSMGSLFELLSETVLMKLFWLNVQQIGKFAVPVTCLYFAAEYGQFTRFRKYLPLFMVIPAVALALNFTDSLHHLMRLAYGVIGSRAFGNALTVVMSPVSQLFEVYNFCAVLIALIMLGIFAAKITKTLRRQTVFIMAAIVLVFAYAFFKDAFLDRMKINIPIAVMFLPSSLLLFYNLFKNHLFLVSPIARDKVFDVIEQGIVVTDGLGSIVDRNPFAVHLLKVHFGIGEELRGRNAEVLASVDSRWVQSIEKNEAGQMEIQSEPGGAGSSYFRIKVYPLKPGSAHPVGTVSIIRDITARRMQEFALMNKAEMDGLTGLLNRNGLMDSLSRLLQEASGTGELVSVLMMDLDKFKSVNDTYGHISGDRVLMLFAEMMRGVLRQKDAVGRIGGDEFAAVLPGVGRAEALAIAERIRTKVEERIIEMEGGQSTHFTLSIGVCDSGDVQPEADEMLKCADRAMYEAKRKSRNCCVVWE